MAVERTVIGASPRVEGTCARISVHVQDAFQAHFPEDTVNMLMMHDLRIGGCIACDRCRLDNSCFMFDGMEGVRAALDASVELVVVSPVYFAGPPSQFKALLDRLQPYFWHRWEGPKRPASLVVVGQGGDPHGYEPLVTCTRSALSCAGFELQHVVPCIGMDCTTAIEAALPQLFG